MNFLVVICLSITYFLLRRINSHGEAIQLIVKYLNKMLHFPKPSSGPNWSLWQADSRPWALCLAACYRLKLSKRNIEKNY